MLGQSHGPIPVTPSQSKPCMCTPSACLPCYSSLLHQFTHFQWEKAGFGQPSLIKHQFKENALLPQFYSKTQVNVLAFSSLADSTRFCSLYFLCSSPLSNFINFPGATQGISWLAASLKYRLMQTQRSQAEKKLSLHVIQTLLSCRIFCQFGGT